MPAATGLTPCTCDRPLIILSHVDQDHYELGRQTAAMHSLKWLLPQQAYGPVFGGLITQIKGAGGQLLTWRNAAPAPSYLAFPWGFVERCTGTTLNGSGLAAFVCLREDPGIAAAKAAIAALPALPPFGAPANTLPIARALAAALAASPHGAGVTAADASLAALRGTLAALAGNNAANTATAVNAGGAIGGVMVGNLGVALGGPAATALGNAAVACVGAFAPTPLGLVALACLHLGGPPATTLILVAFPNLVGVGANVQLDQGAAAARARAAVAAIAAVPGLAGAPAGTQTLAEPVAAAVAAASPAMPAATAAHAAVRAIVMVLNGSGAPAVAAGISAGGAVFGIAAVAVAVPPATCAAIANAALAVNVVGAAPGEPAITNRANAAAGAFPTVSAPLVRAALDPDPSMAFVAAAAPFVPGERYVLLNGDANYDDVPTLAQAAPPVVVTLTAMHHGAYLEGREVLNGRQIPWAPGSAEAGLVATADVHPASTAQAVTAVTNQLAGAAVANLKTDVCRAGAAAAAAVYAAHQSAAGNATMQAYLLGNAHDALMRATAAAVLASLAAPVEAAVVSTAALTAAASDASALSAHAFGQAGAVAMNLVRGPPAMRSVSADLVLGIMIADGTTIAVAPDPVPGALAALGGQVPAAAPANTALFARPVVAALAQAWANGAAVTLARTAIRAVIGHVNGPGAFTGIAAGDGLGCGMAGVGLGVTDTRKTIAANTAIAAVDYGQAAIAAAIAEVGNVLVVTGGLAVVPPLLNLVAEFVAVALSLAMPALAAGHASLAAVRAAVAAVAGAPLGTIATTINGLPLAGGAIPQLPGPLPPLFAVATARAAQAVAACDATINATRNRQRATGAAAAFNEVFSTRVQTAVRAAGLPELATDEVARAALAQSHRPPAAVTAAAVQLAARQSAAHLLSGFAHPIIPANPAALRPLLALLVGAAEAGASALVAGAGPITDEIDAAWAALGLGVAAPGPVQGQVNALMALSPSAPWGAVNVDYVARLAALLAMTAEAARRSNQDYFRILAAVDAVMDGKAAAALAVSAINAGQGPGPLVYSYGVLPPTAHCYRAPRLGDLGHPHPLAVRLHEARGWTVRRNTSLTANHGALQSDASPAGHVRLSWNDGGDTNHAMAAHVQACPVCGQNLHMYS